MNIDGKIPRTGIYRHYKGAYYLVLCTAQHTERPEKLVMYVPLTGNVGRAGLRLRARPLLGKKGFLTAQIKGKVLVERFHYIGYEMPGAVGKVVG